MIIGLKFLILILGVGAVSWAFLRWNGSIGPRYHEHEAAWQPARVVDKFGLTPFQRLAESRLRETLAADGFQLADRTHHQSSPSDPEPYVQATIAGTPLIVWIYLDGGTSAVQRWIAGSKIGTRPHPRILPENSQ